MRMIRFIKQHAPIHYHGHWLRNPPDQFVCIGECHLLHHHAYAKRLIAIVKWIATCLIGRRGLIAS